MQRANLYIYTYLVLTFDIICGPFTDKQHFPILELTKRIYLTHLNEVIKGQTMTKKSEKRQQLKKNYITKLQFSSINCQIKSSRRSIALFIVSRGLNDTKGHRGTSVSPSESSVCHLAFG